jgi:hypothetical protein
MSEGIVAGWDESGYDGWRMASFNSNGSSTEEETLVNELRDGKQTCL